MNFKAVQNPRSLKLYWELAVPLAALTIVFPVIGPRMLRWVFFAPRTYVTLLLVLLIDLASLISFILVSQGRYATSNKVVSFWRGVLTSVCYAIYPWATASAVLGEEIRAFKRSKDHPLKAVFRVCHKSGLLFGPLLLLVYIVSQFSNASASYYV